MNWFISSLTTFFMTRDGLWWNFTEFVLLVLRWKVPPVVQDIVLESSGTGCMETNWARWKLTTIFALTTMLHCQLSSSWHPYPFPSHPPLLHICVCVCVCVSVCVCVCVCVRTRKTYITLPIQCFVTPVEVNMYVSFFHQVMLPF